MIIDYSSKVKVLDTDYAIVIKAYSDDDFFAKNAADGYCDYTNKEIGLCNLKTDDRWKNESELDIRAAMDATLRHEIVHAFLYESGLYMSSASVSAWAENEEMVDWFALQGPKIVKAWFDAGCVRTPIGVMNCKKCVYYQKAEMNSKGFLICPASGMEITLAVKAWNRRADNE